jgi:hypothetical protein
LLLAAVVCVRVRACVPVCVNGTNIAAGGSVRCVAKPTPAQAGCARAHATRCHATELDWTGLDRTGLDWDMVQHMARNARVDGPGWTSPPSGSLPGRGPGADVWPRRAQRSAAAPAEIAARAVRGALSVHMWHGSPRPRCR